MPLIVINDTESKEQMRSNMREQMRHSYRGGGNYRDGKYRTEEAYKEGYEHGWKDSEEEHYRRDSRGKFI